MMYVKTVVFLPDIAMYIPFSEGTKHQLLFLGHSILSFSQTISPLSLQTLY